MGKKFPRLRAKTKANLKPESKMKVSEIPVRENLVE